MFSQLHRSPGTEGKQHYKGWASWLLLKGAMPRFLGCCQDQDDARGAGFRGGSRIKSNAEVVPDSLLVPQPCLSAWPPPSRPVG